VGARGLIIATLAMAGCTAFAGLDELTFLGPTGAGAGSGVGGAGGGPVQSGGSGGSGGGVGGSQGMPPCGKFESLVDNFDDGNPSPWWDAEIESGFTVDETGGSVALAGEVDASGTATFRTRFFYELKDSRVSIELLEVVIDPTSRTYFEVLHADGSGIYFLVEGGELRFQGVFGGDEFYGEVPYDPIEHRWLQLRESEGTTYWETSSDGKRWVVQADEPTASLFESGYQEVILGLAADGLSIPALVRYDNLNGGSATPGPSCKTSTLRDPFDGTVLPFAWARGEEDDCTIENLGGELIVNLDTIDDQYCERAASHAFDLTGDSITVRLATAPSTDPLAEAAAGIVVRHGDDEVIFGTYAENLECSTWLGGAEDIFCGVPYVPDDHRWLRLREAGGTIHWEVSADGTAFTELDTLPSPFPLTSVSVGLYGLTGDVPAVDPGSAHFDDYNLTTP
jgi:hypothetical protein